MDAKIHFQNEPFMAFVRGKGTDPILCTPIIYDGEFDFGLGVSYEGGGAQVWGLVCPRNMITAWRGTEVLRLLTVIENGTLCHAYYAGQRDPHSNDFKTYVQAMIEIIGQETYDKIMSMKVPEKIISAILDNQKDDGFKPDLDAIIDEVRAGTITWRQEFEDAGLTHPDKIDAEILAQEQTIKKFEKLLQMYAKSIGQKRDCAGMGYVESALLTIVSKETSNAYPNQVLIALAGTVGNLAGLEFAHSIFPPANISQQSDYDAMMERERQTAIDRSAKWLATNWAKPMISLFRKNEVFFTFEEAKQLLAKLLNEYFPVKEPVA